MPVKEDGRDSISMRLQGALGLMTLLLVAILVAGPLNKGGQTPDQAEALNGARELAQAVLDYHSDHQAWPLGPEGWADQSLLIGGAARKGARIWQPDGQTATRKALLGALAGGGDDLTEEGPAYLTRIPVDPWQKPYQVVVMGDRQARDPVGLRSGYPVEPPPGSAILVLSAGPNGQHETDLARLWSGSLQRRLEGRTVSGGVEPEPVYGGDDVGFVLIRSSLGDQP